jgi:hypothetical protein
VLGLPGGADRPPSARFRPGLAHMDLLTKLLLTLGLAAAVIWLLSRKFFERFPQNLVIVAEAVCVGLIALYVFYGDLGTGFGLLCAGGALGLGGALYALLWLMERWAKGGGD